MEYKQTTWDLSMLAPNHRTPMFQEKTKEILEKAVSFEEKKNLLKNNIKAESFYCILHNYEEIIKDKSRIGHYAHLLFSSDTSDAQARSLVAQINEVNAEISNKIMFFSLWWKKRVDEKNAERIIKKSGQLRNYLERQRRLAEYALTELEERIINIKNTTGISFLRRLYDQYVERFNFRITVDKKRQEITKPELVAKFYDPEAEMRRRAYRSLLGVYKKNEDVLGELYRSIVLDWKNEGINLRGYESPLTIRNILNDVSDKAVEMLLIVCRKNKKVFQKYFKHKAKLLNMKRMSRYHIYAPINTSGKHFSFSEGIELVLKTMEDFSPMIARLARRVLEDNHIDSQIRTGKRGGAFCATVNPKITPFILVNYTYKQRDVFTLAHEFGHAVHSLLASDKSILIQNPTLPLAELASVFFETLLFEKFLKTASQVEKERLIVDHLDSLYQTIMRQAYFSVFENDAHEVIKKGATVNEISDVYFRNLKEQFGSGIGISEFFKYEWTYIPHFFHTPFYTYAYSFGNLLSIALFQKYRERDRSFKEEFIKLLSAGGSRNPERLLEEVGIKITSEDFWQSGFNYINERINELISLTKKKDHK